MAYGLVFKIQTVTTSVSKKILAQNDATLILALILATILLRVATLPWYPIPAPYVHDEFSNLLGAETFSLGRLTNPPLLFPESFREIHVLSEPTRMMKYQPALSFFLTLGMVIFGNAYWGVVLCMALMVGSSYWAIKAWTNTPIGLAAAAFILVLLRAPHYWMNSYWGAGPIVLASFLMLGAYAHIILHHRFTYSWIAMTGIILAAISRPFEGVILILCLTMGAIFAIVRFERKTLIRFLKQAAPPFIILGTVYAAFQLYYNYRITGSWWTLPYMLYDALYGVSPVFIFGHPKPEHFSSHYMMQSVQTWEMENYINKSFSIAFVAFIGVLSEIFMIDRTPFIFITTVLLITLLTAAIPLPGYFLIKGYRCKNIYSGENTVLYVCCFALTSVFFITSYSLPHYLGPYFVVFILMICRWIYGRCQSSLRPDIPKSAQISYLSIMLIIAIFPGTTYAGFAKHWHVREVTREKLESITGKDLVFVDQREEAKDSSLHENWVYNPADFDAAPVLWAWYLSPKENQKVIAHYSDRKIWYISPRYEGKLMPYNDHKERSTP
jgi:hypothetical protein